MDVKLTEENISLVFSSRMTDSCHSQFWMREIPRRVVRFADAGNVQSGKRLRDRQGKEGERFER